MFCLTDREANSQSASSILIAVLNKWPFFFKSVIPLRAADLFRIELFHMWRVITDMTGIVSVRGRKSFTDCYCLTLGGDAVFGWTTKQAPRFGRWMRKENGLWFASFCLHVASARMAEEMNPSWQTWKVCQDSVPALQMCEMWISNGVVYSYSRDQTGRHEIRSWLELWGK